MYALGSDEKKSFLQIKGNAPWLSKHPVQEANSGPGEYQKRMIRPNLRKSDCEKWPFYCPKGSGTLRQQLLMMHGIAWY